MIRSGIMKKITATIVLIISVIASSAQTNHLFLRRDTILLKAEECNWFTPPEFTMYDSIGTVGDWFIWSIKSGKVKAVDCVTGKNIPANKILFWNMPADTVAVADDGYKISKYMVTQHEIDPSKISRIRIQQNWYLDAASGKLFSRISCIDLLVEVFDSSGLFRGFKPFCRINYLPDDNF